MPSVTYKATVEGDTAHVDVIETRRHGLFWLRRSPVIVRSATLTRVSSSRWRFIGTDVFAPDPVEWAAEQAWRSAKGLWRVLPVATAKGVP